MCKHFIFQLRDYLLSLFLMIWVHNLKIGLHFTVFDKHSGVHDGVFASLALPETVTFVYKNGKIKNVK